MAGVYLHSCGTSLLEHDCKSIAQTLRFAPMSINTFVLISGDAINGHSTHKVKVLLLLLSANSSCRMLQCSHCIMQYILLPTQVELVAVFSRRQKC